MPRIAAASRLKVVFAGMVAADAGQGGAAWAVLQYILGLEHLGHDVCFVEPISPSKLRPLGAALTRSDASRRFVRYGRCIRPDLVRGAVARGHERNRRDVLPGASALRT